MRYLIQVLVVLAMFSSPLAAKAQTSGTAEAVLKMGAYVSSDDMDRSRTFYQTLFARKPALQLDDFIAFDFAGGWFAIVSRDRYAPGSVPGSGAVPYIHTNDLERIRQRGSVAQGGPAPDIIDEPGIQLLKLKDPDGQLIEFFSLTVD
ncbi:VOC family protein [Roseibium sp. SCP14]|uniref:VOC family protein n=1 Tax=Roseibium sp. SCP14 TaxID=3141375 RepID=UPI003338AE4C